jgi:Domain of unknown function (DUF892)
LETWAEDSKKEFDSI